MKLLLPQKDDTWMNLSGNDLYITNVTKSTIKFDTGAIIKLKDFYKMMTETSYHGFTRRLLKNDS